MILLITGVVFTLLYLLNTILNFYDIQFNYGIYLGFYLFLLLVYILYGKKE